MSDVLPPLADMLAKFDSGKVPRSETWHLLISGLYLNNDKVNEIENWYNTILDLTSVNQQLASDIKLQHDQIEIWYGQIDTWQQQVSQNTTLAEQYKDDAQGSATASQQYSAAAKTQADRSETEADRAETVADGLAAISNPNLLINGEFSVWQRGTIFTEGDYAADRWWVVFHQSGQANQDTDAPAGLPYSLALTSTLITFGQAIELPRAGAALFSSGTIVTLSGWYRGEFDSEVFLSLKYRDQKSSNQNEQEFTSDQDNVITTSQEWKKFSIQYISPVINQTNTVLLLETSGINGSIKIAGFKLELGSVATPFIPDDPETNLAKCQRYYRKDQDWRSLSLVRSDGYTFKDCGTYPVTMRAKPTIKFLLTSDGGYGGTVTIDVGSYSAADAREIKCDVTAGRYAMYKAEYDAEI